IPTHQAESGSAAPLRQTQAGGGGRAGLRPAGGTRREGPDEGAGAVGANEGRASAGRLRLGWPGGGNGPPTLERGHFVLWVGDSPAAAGLEWESTAEPAAAVRGEIARRPDSLAPRSLPTADGQARVGQSPAAGRATVPGPGQARQDRTGRAVDKGHAEVAAAASAAARRLSEIDTGMTRIGSRGIGAPAGTPH